LIRWGIERCSATVRLAELSDCSRLDLTHHGKIML
jgi:hypothetical protein